MQSLLENLKHLPSTFVALCFAVVAALQSIDPVQLGLNPALVPILTKFSLWASAAGAAVLIGRKTFLALKTSQAKKLIIVLCLLMPLDQLSCSRKAGPTPPTVIDVLERTAKAVEAVSIAANNATKAILQAMPEETPEGAQVLAIIQKIVLADEHAKNVVIVLKGQALTTPAEVAKTVLPILREMRAAIDDGLLGLKDPDVKKRAQVWLDVVSITVTSIQGILEVYGASA